MTGWWRSPEIIADLGSSLAELFAAESPTVVMGPESHGSMLAALVARHRGVGLISVRKDPRRLADSDAWWEASTEPDYADRHLRLGVRRTSLGRGDRVLFVDDWIETGAQARACRAIVEASGASWIGAAVVVDGLRRPPLRRELGVCSLLHIRDLG